MSTQQLTGKLYRQLPKMDTILDELRDLPFDASWISLIATEILDDYRAKIKSEQVDSINVEEILNSIKLAIVDRLGSQLKTVINGTGVVIHTNLGRAPISDILLKTLSEKLSTYNNLEFNLVSGNRGSRYAIVLDKLKLLTGAEDAIVVNNNAAAVLLILSALASGKRAIVSRGELVEIGGSFRIPEVMKLSGCDLIEVGTTNKTHFDDYKNAIDESTAMVMKVHTSNYKILGFTSEVDTETLKPLCETNDLLLYEDLGSGLLKTYADKIFDEETPIREHVKSCDILSFSGDKLLGGPQCGIIVGKKELIEILKKHQLLRALRIDKFSLAILDEVLTSYFKKEDLFIEEIVIAKYLNMTYEKVKQKTTDFLKGLDRNATKTLTIESCDMVSEIGAGSMPLKHLSSHGILIRSKLSANRIMTYFRSLNTPIIGRIEDNDVLLDFRTIEPCQFENIYRALYNLYRGGDLDD